MSNHFYPWALDRDQKHLLPDPIVIEDDQKEPIEISPDHVVTKDVDGNPRSKFEDDKWDFRGQIEGGMRSINFSRISDPSIRNEAKELGLYMWTFSENGFSTIRNQIELMIGFAEHCARNDQTLKHGLTKPELVDSFLPKYRTRSDSFSKAANCIQGIQGQLSDAFQYRIPVDVLDAIEKNKTIQLSHARASQAAIIPSRIYSLFTEMAMAEVERLSSAMEAINGLYQARTEHLLSKNIRTLSYEKAVSARKNSTKNLRNKGVVVDWDAVEAKLGKMHGRDRRHLKAHLNRVHALCLCLIAQFTGMRIHELLLIPYDGLECKVIKGREVWGINSFTKKLNAGNPEAEFWPTSKHIVPVFELAQAIAKFKIEHLAYLNFPKKKYEIGRIPLFINSQQALGGQSKEDNDQRGPLFDYQTDQVSMIIRRVNKWVERASNNANSFAVTKDQMTTLRALDPDSNWTDRKQMKVGKLWPFSLHQFRRSMIVYAANAGVSTNVLQGQAKHTFKAMTDYYGRGSALADGLRLKREVNAESGLATFLVSLKEEEDFAEAHSIFTTMKEVSEGAQKLFGVEGARLQKDADNDELDIRYVNIEATKAAVKKGDLHYRETQLGACTFGGQCHKTLDVLTTPCATCGDAILRDDPDVIAILQDTVEELNNEAEKPNQPAPLKKVLIKEAKSIEAMIKTAPSQQQEVQS